MSHRPRPRPRRIHHLKKCGGHFTVSLPFGQRYPQLRPTQKYHETLRSHIVRITRPLWVAYLSGQHEKCVVATYHNTWFVPYIPWASASAPSYRLCWDPNPVLSFLHHKVLSAGMAASIDTEGARVNEVRNLALQVQQLRQGAWWIAPSGSYESAQPIHHRGECTHIYTGG